MKIGIFGGTFDPFTKAHYEIVNKVLKDKLVDKVIVIPTIVDYYRKDKERMFSNKERLEIVNKWFENREDVIVDDSEYKFSSAIEGSIKYDVVADENAERKRISERRYWHTLQDVMKRYGDNEYTTIVGTDSWNNIESWFNYKELFRTTKFIVIRRANEFSRDYPDYYPYYIFTAIDEKFDNVSATNIRKNYKHLDTKCRMNEYKGIIEEYLRRNKNNVQYSNLTNIQDEILIHTPIFDLVKGPNVEAGFRPVKIKSPDWVSIIVEKDGKFLMEKQLRYGLNKEFEEFPCGMIEEGEQPIVAALRELEEETGMKLHTYDMSYLGKYAANPAFMTNYMHYFYVKPKIYDVVAKKFDTHEHITSYWVEKKEAFDRFLKSEGSAIMGCCWMLLMKNGIIKPSSLE